MKVVNDAHQNEFAQMPDVVAKAPGRFHLIGEHSWFFKDKTLSMAINLPVYIAASRRSDSTLRFYFHQLNERKKASISSLKLKKEDKWANSIKAIVYGFTSGGFDLGGMDITVYSEILPSAGFGINTAIKIASAYCFRELFKVNCSDVELLQVIERGNRLFLQQENYLSDNFSAMFAKKDTLIITDHQKNTWDYVSYNFPNKKIFLVDTKVPRVSVWNEETIRQPEYALLLGDLRERKANVYGGWCYITNVTDINEELSVVSEEIQHKLKAVISEHNDLIDAQSGLANGDFFKFARAVNHSHVTMRDVFDISCPEIDWILKRVNELEPNLEQVRNPVTCGRITGKGFGRCLYAIIRESDEQTFKDKINEFEKIFGFHPSVYEIHPSDGASILQD